MKRTQNQGFLNELPTSACEPWTLLEVKGGCTCMDVCMDVRIYVCVYIYTQYV